MATVQNFVRITGSSGSKICTRDLTSEQWQALLSMAPTLHDNKVALTRLLRAFGPMDVHEALMLINAAMEMAAKNEVNSLAA